MSSVSVVIPNFNGHHILPTCLDSLLTQTLVPNEIIVVDDASTDDSTVLIRERYPQVSLVEMPSNVGFCRAVNVGLLKARGDFVALLNNDTEADPHWLAEAVGALETRPRIGCCASKMLFYDRRDRVNSAGLFMRVDGVGRDIGYNRPNGQEFAGIREVFGASGGAAVYRRTMLDDVGLLDEDLVAYAEDLDLSFRAQLRGWSCLYVPTAIVYHRMGATYQVESSTKVYLSSRNMLLVYLKNAPATLLRRHWWRIGAAQVYQVLYFSTRGHGWSAISGKVAALKQLRTTLAKRNAILNTKRVSDEHIHSILKRGLQDSIHLSR